MFVRRGLYYWQLAASLLLPLWLFVGWGIWGGRAWTFFGVAIAAPVLFVALLIVTLLIYGRSEVRRDNAVSWMDAALLSAWHLSIVGFGFFGATTALFGILAVVLGLAAFWGALWQLVKSFTRRAGAAMRDFEARADEREQSHRTRPRSVSNGGVYVVYEGDHPSAP